MTAPAEASAQAPAPAGRVPDFFIVGHAKSGTTALYEMLGRQPGIYLPEVKETQYFARELHPRTQSSRSHPDTLAGYVSLFAAARPDQLAGEVSPSYLRSLTAAGRIAALRPDARIIAILREPASFIRSLHLQLLEAHVETEPDLARAIALEGHRREQIRTGGMPVEQGLLYSEHVRYAEQLRRYHAVFPREQVLVLIYDDFRQDNERTVRSVLRFLDVEDSAPIEASEANPSVRVRSARAYRLERTLQLGRGPVAGATRTAIKALTTQGLRHRATGTLHRLQRGSPRPADEDLMLDMRRRFKAEVVALSEYLDRDLVTLWGYDSVP